MTGTTPKLLLHLNKISLTFLCFLSISIAHATNTTDLILKKAPIEYPDGEGIALDTNKGEFIFQASTLTGADKNLLYAVKKGACLTVTSKSALSDDSKILKINKCKH